MIALVSALFFRRADAERSARSLLKIGIECDAISTLMGEETRNYYFSDMGGYGGRRQWEDIDCRKVTGGNLLSALAASAAPVARNLFLPGVSLIGSGPVVPHLALAGSGGSNKSFLQALHSMGINEKEARRYAGGLRSGGIIVCAHVPRACAPEIQQMLNVHSSLNYPAYMETDE